MTKLFNTQVTVLGAAPQHERRNVLPLPDSLREGAAGKVVGALLSRGLIAETVTNTQIKADAALNHIWHNNADGRAILLQITDAGLAAIDLRPENAEGTEPLLLTHKTPLRRVHGLWNGTQRPKPAHRGLVPSRRS